MKATKKVSIVISMSANEMTTLKNIMELVNSRSDFLSVEKTFTQTFLDQLKNLNL